MKTLKIILISLIVLVSIGFLLYRRFFAGMITPISLPSESSKTEVLYKKYVNKKVGYEITIPYEMTYEEKMDGQFVTLGNKIIVYLLTTDPEKCKEECPVVDSKETVNINGQDARFFKLHWQYDGVNTPQSFVNYVFSLKDKYLVFQLQEVDFNQDVDVNHQIGEINLKDLDQFNKIVASLII